MDHRVQKTIRQLKDAFLQAIREVGYEKLTIAGLSSLAGISRVTFYLHYKEMHDVLESVIDDAWTAYEDASKKGSVLLFCRYLAGSETYRCLLTDPALRPRMVQRICQQEREEAVPKLMAKTGLPMAQADLLFRALVSGTLEAGCALNGQESDPWDAFEIKLHAFVDGGIREIAKMQS